MNRFLYQIMYWLRMTNWNTDETPQEVKEVFENGSHPSGPVLDLGCGIGTNVIYMARQGVQAIGLDFVPSVIKTARRKAHQEGLSQRTCFEVADVTRLEEIKLPLIDFALDMGCYHGLSPDGKQSYITSLANIVQPGGLLLLYALDLHKEAGISFGLVPGEVEDLFIPRFKMTRSARSGFWSRGSTWFWLERQPDGIA